MGPLPRLYQVIVVAVLLALCLAGGVWVADYFDLPLGGIGLGLGAGCALAYLLTRDFSHAKSIRITRRH